MKPASPLEASIREAALAFPEATEDFPWGERAFKVKGKVFLFLRGERDEISLSVKLPKTCFQALALPFAQPTGYGLGRSGWVTARFGVRKAEMLEQVREWLDESYRAVAPKKLVARLDGGESAIGRAASTKGAGGRSAKKAARTAKTAARTAKRTGRTAKKARLPAKRSKRRDR